MCAGHTAVRIRDSWLCPKKLHRPGTADILHIRKVDKHTLFMELVNEKTHTHTVKISARLYGDVSQYIFRESCPANTCLFNQNATTKRRRSLMKQQAKYVLHTQMSQVTHKYVCITLAPENRTVKNFPKL